MIGKVLADRYEIIEKIGVGGMAVVYKAKDRLLRREVAVKILKDHFAEDSEFSDKFEIEAQSAASLSHPNIVSIYDVGSEKIDGKNVHYIVMELIKGITLKELIVKNGSLSNRDTVNYSIQIAKALKAAHKNNIIHRDIKPQNIMITEDGIAKVTDFGIARLSTSATITYTSSILGTVHYISPEQAKGKYINYKSDIYSLGIVMYEMVTGEVPFHAENSVGIALKHIQEKVVPPKTLNPNVSDKLNAIILKCLEKNPDDRFEDAQDLIDNLKSGDVLSVSYSKLNTEEEKTEDETVSIYRSGSNKKDKDDNKSKSTVKNITITIILAVIFVSVFFFAYMGLKDRFSTETIEAPNLINLSEDEAISALENAGLPFNIVRKVNEDVQKGIVFDQDPRPGSELEETDYVDVIVSEGGQDKTMPNLTGKTLEEGENILSNQGLTINVEKYESSDEAEGTIIGQSPAAGEKITAQTQITIVISKEPEEVRVEMPNILGFTQSAGISSLVDAGLVVGDIERRYSDEYPKGTIMWQAYEEGTELEEGSSIDIIVSKGEEPIENKVDIPEDTIILSDSDTEEDVKLYTFHIQPPEDKDSFNLKIIRSRAGEESEVYNKDHDNSSEFDINFLDYTDSNFEIYYDNELVLTS